MQPQHGGSNHLSVPLLQFIERARITEDSQALDESNLVDDHRFLVNPFGARISVSDFNSLERQLGVCFIVLTVPAAPRR
jgi:hypothetical protein